MADSQDDDPPPSSPLSKPARPALAPFFAPKEGEGAGATPTRARTPSERARTPSERATQRPFASPPAKGTPEKSGPRVTPPALPPQRPQSPTSAESDAERGPGDAPQPATEKEATSEWLEEPAWLRDNTLPAEHPEPVRHEVSEGDLPADTDEEPEGAREWEPEKTGIDYGGEHGRPDSFALDVELDAGAARMSEFGSWQESQESREISDAFAPRRRDAGGGNRQDISSPALGTESDEDVFWDPAEEPGMTLDQSLESLERLKEEEPWGGPVSEDFQSSQEEDVAAALERIAQRIRTGELIVPPATPAESDAAVLACVLAALLRPGNG